MWLILAGRGFGKTWTGAYDLVNYALKNPKTICAVIAPTFGDLRRVCFEGISGINNLIPKKNVMQINEELVSIEALQKFIYGMDLK